MLAYKTRDGLTMKLPEPPVRIRNSFFKMRDFASDVWDLQLGRNPRYLFIFAKYCYDLREFAPEIIVSPRKIQRRYPVAKGREINELQQRASKYIKEQKSEQDQPLFIRSNL